MTEIRVNISFRSMIQFKDTTKRSEHVFDRMMLRGITKDNIKEAVQKGVKKIRADNSMVADFRWFRVIYREFRVRDIRKIYPITVFD